MSFGIYLVHFVLVGAVYRLFGMLHLLFLPASLSIPLLTAATCLAAWGIIKLLSFLPRQQVPDRINSGMETKTALRTVWREGSPGWKKREKQGISSGFPPVCRRKRSR